MSLILSIVLFSQIILDPQSSQRAYTTADPINSDRLGLATETGRFSVLPVQNCDDIGVGQNVLIYPNFQLPPWLAITTTDGNLPGCVVRVEGRMSDVPCFQTDSACDVVLESD